MKKGAWQLCCLAPLEDTDICDMSLAAKYPKYNKRPLDQESQDDQPNQLKPRIIGLQRGQAVKPLLQSINGKPRNTITKPIVNKPVAKLTMVAEDDPPLSSTDDEQPNRADIHHSTFVSTKKLTSPDSTATRLKAQSTSTREKTRSSARTKSDTKSQPSSSASRRHSEDEEGERVQENRKRKSVSQEQPGNGFPSDFFPRPNQRKYTSKQTTVRVPKMIARFEAKDDSSPIKQGLMLPKGSSTKQELTPSPKKGLVVPAGGNSSPTKGSPLRKRLKESPGRKAFKIEDSPEESRPKFIIPPLLPSMKEEDLDGYEISGASTVDLFSRSLSPLSDIEPLKSSVPVCPMCNEEVDENVLKKFKKIHPGLRMTLRQENLFCTFHKKKSAAKIWRKKRYPEIDWNGLDERIAKHYKFLRAILQGGESHYGDIFSQKIKSGQNRTLLKSEDDLNLSPGYYGARGLRAMTDNLTWKFSSLLRERSVKDRLISARGHTAYVQAVLVPELAVQLIKDDMGVDVEKARVIMEESISVGELMNEEVGDVVLESDESDSGM